MVIVRPDGSIILDGGDPDFSTVQDLGAEEPTNFVLDPDPNKPLSQFILERFGIPFQFHSTTGRVLGGVLPGYDIRNQDATTMMKLALAVELRSNPDPNDPAGVGEFAEVEIDEFGIARFYIVGQETADNLDIRYCVPTAQVVNPADLVIVRGYDPPPRRELRTSFDGLKNAELFDYKECAADSCQEQTVGRFASISYDDPLLDQTYLDDVVNSYELQAFETLLGYVVDLDLPSGADPDLANFRPGLKITFGDTTTEYIRVPSGVLNSFILNLGTPAPIEGGSSGIPQGLPSALQGGLGSSSGFTQALGVTGIGGQNLASAFARFGTASNDNGTTLTVRNVDPRTGECQVEATSVIGSQVVLPASRFQRENKFGNLEPDFVGVKDVVFSGRKVTQIFWIPTSLAALNFAMTVYVKPSKQLVSLEAGKNWTWTVDEDDNVILEFFSFIEDAFTAQICGEYQRLQTVTLRTTSAPNLVAEQFTAPGGLVCNVGDSLGYKVEGGEICIVVERKRPTIDVFDPNGEAIEIASQFVTFLPDSDSAGVVSKGVLIPGVRRQAGVRYTPIVIVDEPAPIAYAATAPLQSIDAQTGLPGSTILPAEGIIDQTDGIRDADPVTVQDFDESQLQVLQDNTNGSTIDISLPFLDEDECLDVAKNFLSLQQATVNSQSIILGPDSDPKLGQVLPDGSIINEINYSYSDGSQYLITITTGPKFLSAGSFQNSTYQLQTEDVSREGTVIQDKGNGAEYVVRIEGFGEVTALSMVLDQITVGDKVSVRLYNQPQEKR